MLVSSDKLNVTVPDVPPPINPSPAVTPVISPGLAATQTITGLASATSVNFHISGVEIS